MAFVSTPQNSTRLFPGVGLSLRALSDGFVAWLVRVGERHSRRDVIAQLNALSDRQLADIGITRDQIVAYVYRDRLGL